MLDVADVHHLNPLRREQRIFEIHRRLKARRRCTAVALAEQLSCDERTIRRDLMHLREQRKMPVQYDPAEHTWFYSKPAGELHAELVSIEDRFALLVAQQAARQFIGTPWYDRLQHAYARLLEMLPDESASKFERVAARIRFEGAPTAPVSPKVWQTISNCIEASESLRMTYQTGHSGETRQREVDPYGLIVRSREWFLIGWDHYRKSVRTFFLPRIKAVDYTDHAFKPHRGFDLDQYLATAVDSHQSTGPVHRVKLRFIKEAAHLGEEFFWNPTQKSSKDKLGRLLVEFETGALYAVERQVLAWGGSVEVLQPRELRSMVESKSKALLALHQIQKSRG